MISNRTLIQTDTQNGVTSMALRATGRDLSRTAFIRTLESLRVEVAGMTVQYQPGNHAGSTFVDLAIVGRDGRFVH